MKQIIQTESEVFGPYSEVLEIYNGYMCDGAFLQTSVVGVGSIVKVADDYVNPGVAVKETKIQNAANKLARANAYRIESDPIFFKSQRGEATNQEWLDKIAEIHARYPYKLEGIA